MATTYRKPAPKRKRTYTKHPEVKLAARIAGVQVNTVYRVKQGRAVSENVMRAIAQARRKLGLAA